MTRPGQVDGLAYIRLISADRAFGRGYARIVPHLIRYVGNGRRPKNWVAYSTDGTEYVTPSDGSTAISIPGAIASSGYFYILRRSLIAAVALMKGQTLLLKLYPDRTTSVATAVRLDTPDSRLHSCVAIEAVPKFSTPKPVGAVYFVFDGLTEGLDYSTVISYCHAGIDAAAATFEWDAVLKTDFRAPTFISVRVMPRSVMSSRRPCRSGQSMRIRRRITATDEYGRQLFTVRTKSEN